MVNGNQRFRFRFPAHINIIIAANSHARCANENDMTRRGRAVQPIFV